MYRLRLLTGRRLAARMIGAQATEVAIRAGVLNRMPALARPSPYESHEFEWGGGILTGLDLCNNACRIDHRLQVQRLVFVLR